MNFYWPKEEVLENNNNMTTAFDAVLVMAVSQKVSMRDAVYMVAIHKVVKAMEQRLDQAARLGNKNSARL